MIDRNNTSLLFKYYHTRRRYPATATSTLVEAGISKTSTQPGQWPYALWVTTTSTNRHGSNWKVLHSF